MKRGVPIKQLDTRHYLDWDGVNTQEFALEPPRQDEDTLALYIVDIETKASKRFTVTEAMKELMARDRALVAYGTRNDITKKKVKIVLQWEKEFRVELKKETTQK